MNPCSYHDVYDPRCTRCNPVQRYAPPSFHPPRDSSGYSIADQLKRDMQPWPVLDSEKPPNEFLSFQGLALIRISEITAVYVAPHPRETGMFCVHVRTKDKALFHNKKGMTGREAQGRLRQIEAILNPGSVSEKRSTMENELDRILNDNDDIDTLDAD